MKIMIVALKGIRLITAHGIAGIAAGIVCCAAANIGVTTAYASATIVHAAQKLTTHIRQIESR